VSDINPTDYRDWIGESVGAGTGEDFAAGFGGGGVSRAFTCSRLSRVTIPLRRYQNPSAVSQASSALTVLPSASRITTGPRLFPASKLVAIGPVLSATRAGSALTAGIGVGVALGEGEGEGDGVALTDGARTKGGGGEIICGVKGC
jgi:hypothetical protein